MLNEKRNKRIDKILFAVPFPCFREKYTADKNIEQLSLAPFEEKEFKVSFSVSNPTLWSVETPYLYKLITTVISTFCLLRIFFLYKKSINKQIIDRIKVIKTLLMKRLFIKKSLKASRLSKPLNRLIK